MGEKSELAPHWLPDAARALGGRLSELKLTRTQDIEAHEPSLNLARGGGPVAEVASDEQEAAGETEGPVSVPKDESYAAIPKRVYRRTHLA